MVLAFFYYQVAGSVFSIILYFPSSYQVGVDNKLIGPWTLVMVVWYLVIIIWHLHSNKTVKKSQYALDLLACSAIVRTP